MNKDGFEVDIIRRVKAGNDDHPVKLSDADEDFYVVQAPQAHVLPYSEGFSQVVVASDGTMARMNTLHPATFAKFKLWMAARSDRVPLKARRDRLQAEAVQHLLASYLPHLGQTPA